MRRNTVGVAVRYVYPYSLLLFVITTATRQFVFDSKVEACDG